LHLKTRSLDVSWSCLCVDLSICTQYLERRECEYDLKTSVDFYKVSQDSAEIIE